MMDTNSNYACLIQRLAKVLAIQLVKVRDDKFKLPHSQLNLNVGKKTRYIIILLLIKLFYLSVILMFFHHLENGNRNASNSSNSNKSGDEQDGTRGSVRRSSGHHLSCPLVPGIVWDIIYPVLWFQV